jgi:DNA-binding PadR family transcriptional regulator
MAEKLGKVKPTRYLNDLVRKMIANKLIEYTIPDKPGSRLQKYRLTDKGRAWLAAIQERLGGCPRMRYFFQDQGRRKFQPKEYIEVFRGLKLRPDAAIGKNSHSRTAS